MDGLSRSRPTRRSSFRGIGAIFDHTIIDGVIGIIITHPQSEE